jgi:hypothetical protein
MIARRYRLTVPRSGSGRLDLVVKEGEDGDIVQAVLLQGGAAQGAFAREAGLLRDPEGCEVVGVDAQPYALQAASGQRPPGEGSQGLGGEAPAAGARADAVADLGATRVPVDIGEVYSAGDPGIVPGEHHEVQPGSLTARLVHSVSQPPVHVRWVLARLHECGRQRKPLSVLQDLADKPGVARAELPDIESLRPNPHLRKVRKMSHRAYLSRPPPAGPARSIQAVSQLVNQGLSSQPVGQCRHREILPDSRGHFRSGS